MKTVESRLKEVKEFVKCPELGSTHYGKWGLLPLQVRQYLDKLATDTLALLEDMEYLIRGNKEQLLPKPKEENVITINLNAIYGKIKGIYNVFGYNNKAHKTLTLKRLITALKRLPYITIVNAYEEYITECYMKRTEERYVKGSEVFLTNSVYDYAEKVKDRSERRMEELYGEKWKEIKFKYVNEIAN